MLSEPDSTAKANFREFKKARFRAVGIAVRQVVNVPCAEMIYVLTRQAYVFRLDLLVVSDDNNPLCQA